MASEKWRRRADFMRSMSLRGNTQSQVPAARMGFINSYNGGVVGGTGVTAGTLSLTVDGTSVAGTIGLLDLSTNRLRIPSAGRAIGGNTSGFGTAANAGGSVGDIVTGFTGASAMIGFNIGGTLFVLQFGTVANSTVVSYPYGAGVA